jgi:hypothetical protein
MNGKFDIGIGPTIERAGIRVVLDKWSIGDIAKELYLEHFEQEVGKYRFRACQLSYVIFRIWPIEFTPIVSVIH